MGKIIVTILDAAGRETQVEVPDDRPVGAIIEKLMKTLDLPQQDGKHTLFCRRTGEDLDDARTLGDQGTRDRETLQLRMKHTSTGLPKKLVVLGLDAGQDLLHRIQTQSAGPRKFDLSIDQFNSYQFLMGLVLFLMRKRAREKGASPSGSPEPQFLQAVVAQWLSQPLPVPESQREAFEKWAVGRISEGVNRRAEFLEVMFGGRSPKTYATTAKLGEESRWTLDHCPDDATDIYGNTALNDLFQGFHPLGFDPRILVACHRELGKAVRQLSQAVAMELDRSDGVA